MPTNNYSKNIVYLSKTQYQELIANNTITVDGQTITYNDNDIYVTPQAEPITTVKINNTAISQDGVANIPFAGPSTLGVVKVSNRSEGLMISSYDGLLSIAPAGNNTIKMAISSYNPIVPDKQHLSVFYGLATAAGDSTQSASSNDIGVYTNEAKQKIQNMLGITDLISTEESSTATAAHAINSIFMMDGKLCRATSEIVIGDLVAIGTNCENIKIDEAFIKNSDAVVVAGTGLGSVKTKNFSAGTSVFSNISSGIASYAFGFNTVSTGNGSLAEGSMNKALAGGAHVEGQYNIAFGTRSHAEGYYTCAGAVAAHAEGGGMRFAITITGAANSTVYTCSHIDESYVNSFIEVNNVVKEITQVDIENNTITLNSSFGESLTNNEATIYVSYAASNYSHIEGLGTIAYAQAQHVQGKYNIRDTNSLYADIVGNGTAYNNRSNAYALDWNGNAYHKGYVYVGCNADSTGGIRLPHDIQINGASIVSNGIATIPVRSNVVSGSNDLVTSNAVNSALSGVLGVTSAQIKEGTQSFRAITPSKQHEATFYGLAKAAGDTTMLSSSNAIGTYTAEAKTAIRSMLGIDGSAALVEEVTGTTPTITGQPNVRYICDEVSLLTITPPACGSVEVIFTSGSTASTLTVPSTVKWPTWFDAENLEVDTIYDIIITDATYGAVMTWAN